jgi:adenylate cyclase
MRLIGVGVSVTLVAVALLVSQPAFLVHLDNKVLDLEAKWIREANPPQDVSIVDIDEPSLARYGRWPWPRHLLGSLAEKIRDAGAAVVAFAVVFPELDPTQHEGKTGDQAFAESLTGGRAVVGHYFHFGSAETRGLPCAFPPVELAAGMGRVELFRASRVICSQPELARAAVRGGFLNASPDRDGMLRRIPLLIEYDGSVYPSLALAVLLALRPPNQAALSRDPSGAALLRLDGTVIPLGRRGDFLLRYRGPARTLPYVSALEVLEDGPRKVLLRGKPVLVGGSAVGMRGALPTPVDTHFPGVEVHATAVSNLLKGDFLTRPPSAIGAEAILLLAAGCVNILLLARTGPVAGALITVGMGAGIWVLTVAQLWMTGVLLSPLMPSAALVVNLSALTLTKLAMEQRRIGRSLRQISDSRRFLLTALESLAAIRDTETGAHLIRIQHYMRYLCQALAAKPRFHDALPPKTIDLLVELAPIHDLGKVGVSDRVLHKPGLLTAEESQQMRRHVEYGRAVLERARARYGVQDEALLQMAREVIYSHHERWDGTGYPEGLKGEKIPLAGRLLAVADVYDALVSRRIYKPALPHSKAVRLILSERGRLFDPDGVDAFAAVAPEWERIASEVPNNSNAKAESA